MGLNEWQGRQNLMFFSRRDTLILRCIPHMTVFRNVESINFFNTAHTLTSINAHTRSLPYKHIPAIELIDLQSRYNAS